MALAYYFWLIITSIVDFFLGLYYKDKREFIKPTNNPILLSSATNLAKQIRNGKLKSEKVVQTYIDRIKEVNEILNAVVDHRFDEALDEAKQIDENIKNKLITNDDFNNKPFLGVPFTSKESTQCDGMNASFGLVPRKGVKATEDADVVKFMKSTGAILIGVTNVPQLNMWWETHNPIYGLTKNPYNSTKCVGGSSGGEAAIIAACGSPIGIGSDIGGSTRIPSFMCGLFGHKSSCKLTSTKGMTFRNGSEVDSTMVVVGPMVRHAIDLIPGIKAMLGPSHKLLNLDDPVDVTKLKYFYMTENGDPLCSNVHTEIKETMFKVVGHFKEVSTIEEINLEGFSSSANIYRYWLDQEKNANFKTDITARKGEASLTWELIKYVTRQGDIEFPALLMLMNNTVMPNINAEWAIKTTKQLKAELLNILGSDGVLFFTSMPTTALYHHASYSRPYNIAYFSIFNALKLPVTQVPLGLSDDRLPLGIQVVAAPNNDRLCVAVAKELEKAFGGYVPPFENL